VSRKIRDFVVTALALLALFAMLVSINPNLRERTAQMVSDREFYAVRSTLSQATSSVLAVVQGYAGDNAYLFTFLVAACIFFVLMQKVIS
jgi:ABC-type multidrug transport system permease subunit